MKIILSIKQKTIPTVAGMVNIFLF